jgi:acylglycerol lipase
MEYSAQEGSIKGFTGVNIYYRQFTTEDANKAVIVVHGFGEHSGRYQNLVQYFSGKQTNFYLFDNRGHGQSSGQRGHVNNFNDYLDDLNVFIKKVREQEPDSELFILGHSMGGCIAAHYLIKRNHDFTGAILSAPGFQIAAQIPTVKKVLGNALSHLIPTFSLSTDLNTNDLSHDNTEVEAYKNDPLVHGQASSRWFTQFVDAGQFAIANAHYVQCPVLIIQGDEDKIIAPSGAEEFYQNLTIEDKEFHWLNGFYHEPFHETKKEVAFQIIEEWLNH